MQHIESLRELVRKMKHILYVCTVIPAIFWVFQVIMSAVYGDTIHREFIHLLYTNLGYWLAVGLHLYILFFYWKRMPDQIEAVGRRVANRYDRIRRMEKRLQRAGVDWETMEEVGFAAPRSSGADLAWIRRAVWITMLCVWGSLLGGLLNFGYEWMANGAVSAFLEMPVRGFFAVHYTRYYTNVVEEVGFLERTMFEQEQRIRSLEMKFKSNNIDVNEIIK